MAHAGIIYEYSGCGEKLGQGPGALIEIRVSESERDDSLVIEINDDGCGMSAEQVRAVTDPFYTTRTTRKVGLGVPLFKMSAEMAAAVLRLIRRRGRELTSRRVMCARTSTVCP